MPCGPQWLRTRLCPLPLAVPPACLPAAQVYLRLKSDDDAIEFCDRALHVCPSHVKALSRRAQAWSNRGEHGKALHDLDKAVRLEQGGGSSNEDLLRQHREAKQLVHDRAAEEAVSSIRTNFKEVRASMPPHYHPSSLLDGHEVPLIPSSILDP